MWRTAASTPSKASSVSPLVWVIKRRLCVSSCGAGFKQIQQLSDPVEERGRTYRGFNLFGRTDLHLFEALARGEFVITGMRNRGRRPRIGLSTAQISHCFKRLRLHGLLKRAGKTYKYYLTDFDRRVALAALKLHRLFLIPALVPQPPH